MFFDDKITTSSLVYDYFKLTSKAIKCCVQHNLAEKIKTRALLDRDDWLFGSKFRDCSKAIDCSEQEL